MVLIKKKYILNNFMQPIVYKNLKENELSQRTNEKK
jgi:hypothetical protein